jgi:cytochrome c oxidase subunit III
MSKELDVSGLPSYKFGHHSLMWWGVMSMIAIEGTAFAIAAASYFYIWSQAREWPMGSTPPGLFWGTLNLIILLASAFPNHWAKKAGEDGDERRIKLHLVVCFLFGVALIVVRAFEYTTLNVRWDDNAYGSVLWMLLSLHTAHLVTDVYDTAVLAAVFFTGRVEGKRHVDVSENGMYWYFVVASWIPIYGIVYWAPRLL